MFRALFMGGYDITKYALDLENKSILWRLVSAQVFFRYHYINKS